MASNQSQRKKVEGTERKTINPAGDGGWIPFTNKYPATCHNCHEDIDIGEKILWKKGTGVKHPKCEKKEIELEEKMPEKITITDKEWKDYQEYKHDVLLKKTECQCCGKKLPKREIGKAYNVYINVNKRVCEKHFLA